MYSLRSVSVLAFAKMMGALYGCIGLIFLLFLLLVRIGSLMFGRGSASSSGIGMLFLAILAPIIYGIMGFIFGALSAWLYNFIARRIGGIQLELEPVAANTQSTLGPI